MVGQKELVKSGLNDGRKKDRKIGKIGKSRYSSRYISVIDENFSK